jgi:RecA/RadA recombinase
MAASAKEIVDGLREEIRRIERRPRRRVEVVPSGIPAVDAALSLGGFPRGALSELAGSRASGKTVVALRAIASALGEGRFAAFVDGRGELYPPAAQALGIDLDRLLIVRPGRSGGQGVREAVRRALWAAEALLASGAFAVVAIDVALERRALAPATHQAMLHRLMLAAERGGAVGLWLAPQDGARIQAAVRLEVSGGADFVRVRPALGGEGGRPVVARPLGAPPVRAGTPHA